MNLFVKKILSTWYFGIIFAFVFTYTFAQTIIPANSTITDPVAQGYATCTPGNCVIQTVGGSGNIASGTATNSLLFWNGTAWTETTAASLNSSGQATLTSATTTNFFSTLLNAVTAIFTNLTTTNLVATNATNTNLISSNATITSATITNLYAPNIFGSVATSTFSQSTTIGATVTNATNTGIFFLHNGVLTQDTTNFNYDYGTKKLTVTGGIDPQYFQAKDVLTPGQNAAYYEAYSGDAAALSAANTGRLRYATSTQSWQISNNGGAYQDIVVSGGNISWLNATGGNATITNIYSGGTFTLTNGTIVGANITNATITNSTSTNLFANLFNAVSAFISTITAGVINVGTINATTTINTLALNASTTNASTTNTITGNITNLNTTSATATNATVTGTIAAGQIQGLTNSSLNILVNGTNTLRLDTTAGGDIEIGTGLGGDKNVTIGSTVGTSTVLIRGGTGGINLNNSATVTGSLVVAGTSTLATTTISTSSITNLNVLSNLWAALGNFLGLNVNGNLAVTGTSTLATTSVAKLNVSDVAVLASTTPSTTTNALYNINGNLYFNGTQLGVAGAGTEWQTINNSGVRLSTTSNSVVIGASATSTTDNFQVIGTAYINGTTTLATTTITNGVITNILVAGGSATLTDATSTFLQIYNLTAATTTLGTTTISTSSITNLNVLATLWANILSVLNLTATNATVTNSTSTNIATGVLSATTSATLASTTLTGNTIAGSLSAATTSVSLLAVGTSTNASTTLTAFRNVANGGVTWTSRSASEANTWSSVTYGNGTFVAVSGSGTNRVMTSTDGITWTARTAAEANPWWAVTYGAGQFVAVSTSGTNQVMTSPDGITWTARAASASSQWRSVVYANGKYVAVASAGATRAMTSTNGITWTSQTAVTSAWRSVTYGNGVYVAVAESGSDRVMTSPDGITWTAQTAADANSWQSVIYAGGQFVAVALDGTNQVMTSPNGVTWTARAASEASAWNSVTYANGTYVAVASSGTNRVMTSSDAITWTSRSASEASIWYSVTAGNGLLVAVAVSGTNQVMTSTDGPTGSTSLLSLGTSLNSNVLVVDDRGYVGVGTTTGLTNLFNINGAITLNSSTPASTANALYSQSGTLYFNGLALATGTSPFVLNGNGSITTGSSTAVLTLNNLTATGTATFATTSMATATIVAGTAILSDATITSATVTNISGTNANLTTITSSGTSTFATTTVASSSITNLNVLTNLWAALGNFLGLNVNGNLAVTGTTTLATTTTGVLGVGTSTNIYGGELTSGITLNNALVLASSTALSTTTNALYNANGTLYFNGSAVASGGLPASSTSLYVAADGKVAVGTSTPSANLDVIGSIKSQINSNANLAVAGTLTAAGAGGRGMVKSGDYVFTTGLTNAVRIIDVSVPTSPRLVTSYTTGTTSASNMTIVGKYLYVTHQQSPGLVTTHDISNISAPVQVATTTLTHNNANRIVQNGKYLYVMSSNASGLSVLDVSNGTPTVVNTNGSFSNAYHFSIHNNYLYANAGNLKTYSLTDPINPTLINTSANISGGTGMQLSINGRYGYVPVTTLGVLAVYDFVNPTAPVLVASTTLPAGTIPMAAFANSKYVYVAHNGSPAFNVLDINASSTAPVLVASTTVEAVYDAGQSMVISGNYAYVDGGINLAIVNLSGIETGSLLAGSAEIGELTVLQKLIAQASLLVKDLLQVGGNANIGGTLSANNATINKEIVLGNNTPATTSNALYNQGGTLYFNGSQLASGLTSLNVVFDSNISNGTAVQLYNDGTTIRAKAVGQTGTGVGNAVDTALSQQIEATALASNKIANAVWVGTSTILSTFGDTANNVYGRAATISGNVATYGSRVTMIPTSTGEHIGLIQMPMSGYGKAVMVLRDVPGGSSNNGAMAISVSGTTVTNGTAVAMSPTINNGSPNLLGIETGVNEFILFASASGGTNLQYQIGDLSGNTITYGSQGTFYAGTHGTSYAMADAAVVATTSATSTILVTRNNNSTSVIGRVCDVNSTLNTLVNCGSELTITSNAVTGYHKIARYAPGKAAVMFFDNTKSNQITVQLLNISGNTITTLGSATQVSSGVSSTGAYPLDMVSPVDNQLLLNYPVSGGGGALVVSPVKVSGSSVTVGSAFTIDATGTHGAYMVDNFKASPDGTKFAIGFANEGTNYYPRVAIGTMSYDSYDERANYYGVVSSSSVANATGTIALYGSVLSNVITNLVAGATYYIDSTGQLTTSVTNYVAGKALSSTQLSLNAALQPPASVSSGSTNVAASYVYAERSTDQTSVVDGVDHVGYNSILTQYGSDITVDTTSPYVTTTNTSSLGRITLKAGKTYRIKGFASGSNAWNQYASFCWYNADTGSHLIASTACGSSYGPQYTSTGGSLSGNKEAELIFTPSIDTRIELRIIDVDASTITSGGTGVVRAYADISVIAGNAAVTGQSVDYVNAITSADTTLSAGATIPFATNSGNIPNASGVFTLTAGKTYHLEGAARYSGTETSDGMTFRWRDITNNTLIGSEGVSYSMNIAIASAAQNNAVAIITPSTNITIRLENTTGATRTVRGSYSYATIKQLGTTATTEYSNNILGNFTASSTIMSGTLSEYINHIQIAQASSSLTLTIPSPANTSLSRIVYIDNTGTANFDMHGVTVGAGETAAFKWNGTTWKSFGNQAANVAAENGEVTTITDGQSTTSTSFVDVSGSSFTLPSAGTWRVTYVAQIQNTTASQQIFTQLTDSSGTLVPGSYIGGTTAAGLASRAQTAVVTITTTGPATYKMQWKVSAGTGLIYNNTGSNGQSGQSRITYQKIGGYLPVIGQTVDYLYLNPTTLGAIGTNITGFTNVQGNITNTSGTGIIGLTAGKTYRLRAVLGNTVSGSTGVFQWFNNDSSSALSGANLGMMTSYGGASSATSTNNNEAVAIFTPTVNTNVAVRYVSNIGSVPILSATSSYIEVTQLGSTAITGVTWSSLIAPIANLTTNMSTYATNFSWSATTSSTTVSDVASSTGLFNLTANSLAIGNLLNIDTSLASSSVLAMRVKGSIAKVFGTNFATSTAYAHNVDFGNTSRVRVLATTSAFQGITGIANGQDGEELTIVNASSTQSFVLYDHTSTTTSSAANRIITGTNSNLTLAGDAAITLVYDSTASTTGRWRVVGGTGGGTSVSSTNLTNFTASSSVGTAALTVDAYTNLNIAQASSSVVLTLPNPTVTTAGKTITVNNTGTAAFEMYDVEVPSQGSAIFIWNGTFWSSIEGKGNVAAEYGSASIAASAFTGPTGGMSTYADVTGGSITVPSAGTWRIRSTGAAQLGSSDELRVAITDNSNNIQGNPVYYTGGGSTINASVNVEAVVTTTGAATFKLRAAAATALVYPFTDPATIWYEKISGNAAMVGQTVDFGQYTYTNTGGFSISTNDTVIPLDTTVSGNIPLSSSRFTLTAGKTYRLVGAIPYTGNASANIDTQFYNVTSGSYIGQTRSAILNGSFSSTGYNEVIFTATTTSQVEFRVRSVAGGAYALVTGDITRQQGPSVTVTQLGSNATTEYSNNALGNFTASTTITATLSEYVNHYQINQASSSVTLTIPNPTNTSLSRIIYIDNIGTANFQMHDVTVGAGETVAFKWNGTTWKSFGRQADNVASEYGQTLVTNTAQTTSSGTYSDVLTSDFTLPSAGVWRVSYYLYVYQTSANGGALAKIVDSSDVDVADSVATVGGSSGTTNTVVPLTNTVNITTTGPQTYNLQWARNTGGTVNLGANASHRIVYEKISGYLPVAGQTVDYIHASQSTTASTATGNAIPFDTVLSGNIPLNTSTGLFTLTAGKTYKLSFSGQEASGATAQWQTAAGVPLSAALISNSTANAAVSYDAIYTPSVNTDVKVTTTSGSIAPQAAHRFSVVITQLGSSAMTSESLLSNGGQISGLNATIGTLGNNFFRIIASSTEYMRVLATGQGLIGTTTINSLVGTSTLSIVATTTNGTANILSLVNTSGLTSLVVKNNGQMGIGTTTNTLASNSNLIVNANNSVSTGGGMLVVKGIPNMNDFANFGSNYAALSLMSSDDPEIHMYDAQTGSKVGISPDNGILRMVSGMNAGAAQNIVLATGMATTGNAYTDGTTRLTLNGTSGFLRLHAYGAGTLTTDASGNVTASSDERLKDVQGNFVTGLDAILNINPINYKWNATSGMEMVGTYTGFSAQNVGANIPEAVATDTRGFLTLSDRPILAAMVNAMKEINGKIFGSGQVQAISIEEITASSTISVDDKLKALGMNAKQINDMLAQLASTTSATSSVTTTETVNTSVQTLSCAEGTQVGTSMNGGIVTEVTSTTTPVIVEGSVPTTITNCVVTTYSTTTTVTEDLTFVGKVIARVVEAVKTMLATASSVFINKVETKELCVTNDAGEKTCLTKEQLDNLIQNAANNQTLAPQPPTPEPQPEPEPEPQPEPTPETPTPEPQPEPTPEPTPEPEN